MSTTVAVVLLIALTFYAVFGGADYGAGVWDLTAGGAERGRRPRALIERAIGPVWEANHVWLIFIFVVSWTAFSEAYASIMLTLFVPLTIAALGIVVRGASFAFRKAVVSMPVRRIFGGGFALSSVVVPYCLAAVAGGIASGRVPAGGKAGDPVDSWINPTSVFAGVLAVAMVAYLAAVYLVWEARAVGDEDLAEYFRRRCVGTGAVVAVVLVIGFFVVRSDAPYVFDGLTSRALPVVIVGVLCGVGALVLLLRGAARGARLLAALAVASVVIGWGVAQWPYLLPESLTVAQAAAPEGTLAALVVTVVLGVVLVVPGFVLLYVLDQRQLLPEEGVD
ncbi:MAG: cytochrome d ubiquinol oxidase subunit II [Nocardioides sp.]